MPLLEIDRSHLDFLSQMGVPVWLFDIDAKSMHWANEGACRLWRAASVEALLARNFSDMSASAYQRLTDYRKSLSDGTVRIEHWTFYPEGEPVTVKCRVRMAKRHHHQAVLMMVEACGEPEKLHTLPPDDLRSIEAIRHSPESVFLCQEDGKILFRNPSALTTFGRSDHHEGDNVSQYFVYPEQWNALCHGAGTPLDTGTVMEVKTLQGIKWHEVLLTATVDPVTGQKAYLLNQRDVSERVRLEKALQRREHTFKQTLDSLPFPVLMADPVTAILHFANQSAFQLLGVDHSAYNSHSMLMWLGEAGVWRTFVRDLESSNQSAAIETLFIHSDGSRGRIRLSGVMLKETGKQEVLFGIVDIETIRAQQDALERALATEREATILQRRFVSMVSHEFRTPLAIIDNHAQRIASRAARGEVSGLADRVGQIRAAIRRLGGMIDDALDLVRADEGQLHLQLESFSLAELITQICHQQQDLNPHITFSYDLDALPQRWEGSAFLLERVFGNLISNAVKYSGESKKIEIRAYAGEYIRISVRDYGVGIPAAELSKLFERFFRASTSQGIPGTGLGLHLAREIVNRHGGQLTVESHVAQGSCFTVSLPWHVRLGTPKSHP